MTLSLKGKAPASNSGNPGSIPGRVSRFTTPAERENHEVHLDIALARPACLRVEDPNQITLLNGDKRCH